MKAIFIVSDDAAAVVGMFSGRYLLPDAEFAAAPGLVVKAVFSEQDAPAFGEAVFAPVFFPEGDVAGLACGPVPGLGDLFEVFPAGRGERGGKAGETALFGELRGGE